MQEYNKVKNCKTQMMIWELSGLNKILAMIDCDEKERILL